ncbi:MAG: class I SAM-dependent methyltransferase [Qingshengfaniella sp.]
MTATITPSRAGVWRRLLHQFLTQYVKHGALHLAFPDGTTETYGEADIPPLHLRLSDPATIRKLVFSPEMAAGEAYMDGTLTIEDDNLHRFFEILLQNRHDRPGWLLNTNLAVRQLRRRVDQHNPLGKAQDNVAHHYDLDGGLYDLFLDEDRQYSCAYFPRRDMTLEAAQEAKKTLIGRKLCLSPDQTVLDIGCGWGGMAMTLARDFGVKVLGVTLSREQHDLANRRIAEAGLSDRIKIRLTDYREVTGQFDRIVSVGMFEHVGAPHYPEFFGKVADLLTEDGVALIHFIGTSAPPSSTSPWVAKYIFPGGYIPSLSEVFRPLEKSGLWCDDMEVWRLHYAYTLRHWFDRFSARRDEAVALYDERFYRMWRYYLASSEMAFRDGLMAIYQIQLSRQPDAVPLTRDYLYRD